MRKTDVPEQWFQAESITPVNNRAYFEPVQQLIQTAEERVWMVMMDSRFYKKKPRYALHTERQDPPSLTNSFQAELITAEGRDVDVKLVEPGSRKGP